MRARLVLTTAAVCAALTLAGCGHSTHTSGATPTPPSEPNRNSDSGPNSESDPNPEFDA